MIAEIKTALETGGYKVHLKPPEKLPHNKKEVGITLVGIPITVDSFESYRLPLRYAITFLSDDLIFIESTVKDIILKLETITLTGQQLYKVFDGIVDKQGALYVISVLFECTEIVEIGGA